MKKIDQKIISLILVASYVGVIFFGVLVSDKNHHHTVCPFSMGQNIICDMSIDEHTGLMKIITQTVSAISLFLFIFVQSFLFFINYLNEEKVRKKRTVKFKVNKEPDIYQILFSKGILNPKSP